jgi:hypothetical protein
MREDKLRKIYLKKELIKMKDKKYFLIKINWEW